MGASTGFWIAWGVGILAAWPVYYKGIPDPATVVVFVAVFLITYLGLALSFARADDC